MRLAYNTYPVLLPHFGYHGSDVYFGSTRLASVAKREGWFLLRCDGTRTLAEAADGGGISADFLAAVWRWFAWWHEPVATPMITQSAAAIERLVLSHVPEAPWFAMGGSLLASPDVSTLLVTCFETSTGAFASGYRSSTELAMAISDEARMAARLAGVQYDAYGIQETRLSASPFIEQLLRNRIGEVIARRKPRTVYVPAAVGPSRAARALHDAVMSLVGEGTITSSIYTYPDLPATYGERYVDESYARYESSFLAPEERYQDVTASASRKDMLLDVFLCRATGAQRRAWRQSAALHAARVQGAAAVERFWEMNFVELG